MIFSSQSFYRLILQYINSHILKQKFLFITPPFTQLNTPYPATAYLKGFMDQMGIASAQVDIGIEVILALFSREGLQRMFDAFPAPSGSGANCTRIFALKTQYINTIDDVVAFLQGKNPMLAANIVSANYLPQSKRFDELADLEWLFGTMGQQDKAKHLATLYLEDLGDYITSCVDPNFGFSRYAERLGRTAHNFDEIHASLQQPLSYIDQITINILKQYLDNYQPTVIALSIPFPGNLFAGFRIAQYVKQYAPTIKVILGGGYANTELRAISDTVVFDYIDFITLDDGEAPLMVLNDYLENKIPIELLKRCFTLINAQVTYVNGSLQPDYKQAAIAAPSYEGLPISDYISVIEIANPMHALWSDGRWNKLTLAHGCYWGKCTFCDISLSYIRDYEKANVKILVDKIEQLITATQTRGFHFVDEAAPPALMKELAIELLRRNIKITWWTNIRFEKSFTQDLCILLAASGCIAVSGGLEVASDRLLKLMDKGVTVSQVAKVADNLTNAGIMVHAYLMYGFPTQTAQETIDSLENVRQLFEAAVIQSGFWHQFAMTAHSPIGKNPAQYKVKPLLTTIGKFANNDIPHEDPTGCNHGMFSSGLKAALFNYMHGLCFEFPLQKWFDFKVPATKVDKEFIRQALSDVSETHSKPSHQLIWLGALPQLEIRHKKNKGQVLVDAMITVHTLQEVVQIQCNYEWAEWLLTIIENAQVSVNHTSLFFADMQASFVANFETDFSLFVNHPVFHKIRKAGLLLV